MLLFILDDLFGVKLWGENMFRRVLHHLSNNNFNSEKKHVLYRIDALLDKEEIKQIQALPLPNYPRLNTSFFAKYEGQYSKKSTLYFNDLDETTQQTLLAIGKKLIPRFEEEVHESLEMGESDFKAMIIRYEGKESKFSMHYDAEHPDCYRTLILYKGEGIVPPFCYDNGKELEQVHLKEGDGIFFKGTQTYHGVFPSGDENTIRYMLGFQYKKKGTKEKKSLCSELRNETYGGILLLFLPYFIYYILLARLDYFLLKKTFKTIPYTLFVFISLVCILLSFQHSNKYGTKIVHSFESILRFYLFIVLFTFDPLLSFLLLGYFTFTEMLKDKKDPSECINDVTEKV
jgi:hypothetical protein